MVFCGIKFEYYGESVCVVVFDGYWVVICDFLVSGDGKNLIIFVCSVDELICVFKDGEVWFIYGDGMFIVIIDCVKMNFKLFDGDFFDYEWVIFKDIKF